MTKTTRRILIGLAIAILLVLAVPVGIMIYAFGGNSPIPDNYRITPTALLLKDGFVDFVMIELGNGAVALVDSGNDPKGTAITAELERRHLPAEALAAVLLTHGHGDHISGCRAFPHADIYAMAAEVPLVEGRGAAHGFLAAMAPKNAPGLRVTHPLHDGETFVLGNRTIRVFATPGHTIGSATYLIDDVLYFGDTAGAGANGHLNAAVGLFSDNPAQNVASLKSLAARLAPEAGSIHTLVFAHTGPLETLDPLLKFAASH